MTSKNWFFSGLTEELKRRLWAAALSAMIFFFSFPVVMVYLTTVEFTDGSRIQQFSREALQLLSYRNAWTIFLMAVLAALLGVSGFSYLNSRQKVDFYHSLPIRREKLFAVQYTAGVLIAAVPYLVFALVSGAVAAAANAPAGEIFRTVLESWAFSMLSFLILYTTAVIAVMMTGNTVVALLGLIVFCAYVPAFLGLWESLAESCLDTFCDYELLAGWVPKTSPFAFYISGMTGELAAGKIFSRLAVWGILLLTALFLHKKRPSEAAGRAMAFPVSRPVIRILLVVECSVAGLLFFWVLGKGLGWAVFGLLAGGVISHCVIEIIYHFDFKKLFSHKLQMVLSLALAFGFFSLFYWDLTGYDRWIPDEGKLQSASVYPTGVDGWVDYGDLELTGTNISWIWTGNQEYISENMKLEDKALAAELARAWNNLPQEDTDGRQENVYVEFVMGGKTVKRRYKFPEDALLQALEKIYADPGYKEGRYPLLKMEPDQVKEVQLSVRGRETWLVRREAVPEEKLGGLLKAYQQDLREMTLEDTQAAPAAQIRFLDQLRLEAVEEGAASYAHGDVEYYPVYPSFSHTLEALQELGLSPKQQEDPEQIRQIHAEVQIPEDSPAIAGGKEDSLEMESWSYSYRQYEETDREMIRRISEEMIYAPYQRYQNLSQAENGIYLDVDFYAESAEEAEVLGDGDYIRTDQGEIYYTARYYLPAGELAEELTDRAIELSESE